MMKNIRSGKKRGTKINKKVNRRGEIMIKFITDVVDLTCSNLSKEFRDFIVLLICIIEINRNKYDVESAEIFILAGENNITWLDMKVQNFLI